MSILGDVQTRIKSVPPIVWVAGGIAVIAVIVFTRGDGGGSGEIVSGKGISAGNGNGITPESTYGQQIADLSTAVAANTAADVAFRKTITDRLSSAVPTTKQRKAKPKAVPVHMRGSPPQAPARGTSTPTTHRRRLAPVRRRAKIAHEPVVRKTALTPSRPTIFRGV